MAIGDDQGSIPARDGGIIVSPLGLQEGAQKVANAENVKHVTLGPDSTTNEYVMRFF
jgi:hypothetical protein